MNYQNAEARLFRQIGFTRQGEPQWGRAVTIRVGVVTLEGSKQKTTVRADSSASRANASEPVAEAVLLLDPNDKAKIGDRLEIDGLRLEISGLQPRRSVLGPLAHIEASLVRAPGVDETVVDPT